MTPSLFAAPPGSAPRRRPPSSRPRLGQQPWSWCLLLHHHCLLTPCSSLPTISSRSRSAKAPTTTRRQTKQVHDMWPPFCCLPSPASSDGGYFLHKDNKLAHNSTALQLSAMDATSGIVSSNHTTY